MYSIFIIHIHNKIRSQFVEINDGVTYSFAIEHSKSSAAMLPEGTSAKVSGTMQQDGATFLR